MDVALSAFPLTVKEKGSKDLVGRQIRHTPTRFPNNIYLTQVDNTTFYSISSVPVVQPLLLSIAPSAHSAYQTPEEVHADFVPACVESSIQGEATGLMYGENATNRPTNTFHFQSIH